MAHSNSHIGVAWHICVPIEFLHNKEMQVSSNGMHRLLVYQFLIATKYKCSQTEKPFPIVGLIDALETSDLKWRARIEAGFPQCMDTAEAFMKGAG